MNVRELRELNQRIDSLKLTRSTLLNRLFSPDRWSKTQQAILDLDAQIKALEEKEI